MNKLPVVPLEAISQRIFIIRGGKVMLDIDLAELYRVNTKDLNKSVKRNGARFPADFMFQLTKEELQNLRFHFGTSSSRKSPDLRSQFVTSSWGGRRYLPYAFTEHGVAMLSSVLRSPRAVQMNIYIIRAFIKLRELLASDKELAHKVEALEREQQEQGAHIAAIRDVLKRLIAEPPKSREAIGFRKS